MNKEGGKLGEYSIIINYSYPYCAHNHIYVKFNSILMNIEGGKPGECSKIINYIQQECAYNHILCMLNSIQ